MVKKPQKPNCAVTMMSSVPYRDTERALGAIIENFPQAPCLPVMTRNILWVLEGIPCVAVNREKREQEYECNSKKGCGRLLMVNGKVKPLKR